MDIQKIVAWIVGGVIALSVLLFGAGLLLRQTAPSSTTPTTTAPVNTTYSNSITGTVTVTKPTDGTIAVTAPSSTEAVIRVPLRSRVSITTKDFLHNGETMEDVQNPGNYVLAGDLGYCIANKNCVAGASSTDFLIVYNAKEKVFHISLLTEPLAAARKDAEVFLQSRLGIDTAAMCGLYYYVETPYWVSVLYTAQNLGFSYCPGAVPL